MLLAFILCFSTLPMTAFAQDADVVTEREEQQEADSAEEQGEQQEADSAEEQEKQQEAAPVTEQKEAEAAAAPGEETSSDKSTTAGEAPDTVNPSAESVSDSDAGTQDTGADDEKKAAVQKVQALIDALPETVTVENAESVGAQLEAIDEAMAELTEEQREELNMTRLHAISEALNTPMTVPMLVAEGKHTDHPICGATCTGGGEHNIVTEWKPIDSEAELQATTAGYYYLTQDIVTTETWKPKNNVVLCLNGHSIAANGDFVVIEIEKGQFTLCDCKSSASTHYFSKSVENNFTRWVPCEKDTENCIPVTGGVITHSAGTSNSGVKVDESGTFTLYGGTICGNRFPNKSGDYGAGVYVSDSTFNMYGGAIRGNASIFGGGVATDHSTFNMYGGVISDNMASAGGGGVVLLTKSVMNMSGNALISANMVSKMSAAGGGLYISAIFEGEGGNCLNMSEDAKISDNTAFSGGAVYVRQNAQVTMRGNAQITNNTATENGGGIYIYESAQVTMSDNAQITNNTADVNGGGVYVGKNTFKIAGGAPQVWNNWCQGTQNNVYLTSGQYIHISKKASTFTGKIGVSTENAPTESNLVTVAAVAVEAEASGRLTEEDLDHICSDKENLYPVLVGGNVKLSATKPHRHPVCGAICGDSESHGNQTWIGVSNLTDITSGGYYYLTDNVTLEKTWTCNDYVALCLNGKTITGAAGADAIKVASGKTLTITDCQDEVGKITHVAGEKGRGIYSQGNLSLYNGEITDNMITSGEGAGVYVNAGSFSMYNGSISANTASAGKGGGVYATNSTGLTISGGSIIGNVAKSGGGIYYKSTLLKAIKFTISGGSIIGNAATNGNGGGVYLNVSSTLTDLTMSGGSITGNRTSINGGGVYMNASGKLTVSGAAKITDNTGTDSSKNNVYLPSGKTIIIGTKGMNSSADIGVTMGQQLTEGERVAIAKGTSNDYTLTADDLNAFNSDTGYYKYALDNAVNFSNGELHVHGLCGTANCTESKNHKNVLWTPIRTEEDLRAIQGKQDRQYYYLTNNIELNNTSWNPTGDILLCLNGHSITANGNFDAITVGSGDISTAGNLYVCDCTGNGKITHAKNKTGRGVNVNINSSFCLWGGSITGNTTDDYGYGGGVYLNGGFGYMYGGSITDNSAKDGGGVAIRTASFNDPDSQNSRIAGYFYMYGGTITGNTATNGGGVAVKDTTSFRTFGGNVTGNTATANGGGVYVESSTANMSVDGTADHTGDVNITGNKDAKGNDSNVYLPGGTNISIGQNVLHNIRIGVTLEKLPAEGNFVKFVEAAGGVTLTDKIAGKFTIDNNSSNTYSVKNIDNSLYVVSGELHEHAICGESCDHKPNHSKVLWTPLTYDAGTQQLMYGSLPVPSEVTAIGAADDQGNSTKAYYTTYKLPAGNYYLADTIEMKGGSVTYNGNTVTSKGGVIEIETDVNLCLNGKWLVTSAPHVGVIVIQKAGTLTLSDCGTDGEIRSSCNAFAGVQIVNDTSQASTFTMYDGAIMYTATGVFMGSNSIFNMYGGTIANNETGVSVVSTSKLTVGGSADITGNDNKNVFLYDKAMITIDSNLKNDARIGVTTEKRPIDKKPIQIATGATGAVLYTEIFKPDKADQGYVVTEDEQGKLYLNVHIHNWLYGRSANGQTITANCDVTGCPKSDGGWVTIDKPEHEVYGDGKSAEATLKAFNWQPDAVTVSNIKYEQPGKILSGAPTDAGTYWASITIGYATAGVQYTINSKKVTDPTIEVADAGTYDGTEKKPSVVVKDGEKVIPDSEYSVSYADNSNAGIATVTITDVAGGNYDVSGSTTFTIGKATITVTPEDDQKTIYGSADLPLRYSCSGAVNGEKPAFAGALSRIMGKDTGKYDITLGTLALADNSAGNFRADNYELKFADTPVQFTIVPKTLSAEDLEFITDSPITKTYDGTTACDTATVRIKSSAIAYDKDVLPTVKGTYAYNSANVTEANEVIFTSEASENQNYILPAGLKLEHAANITKADQAALTITSTSATYGTDLSLTVGGGSGDGALTYTVVNDTGAATISGSTLQPVRAGQVTVQATKAGDDNYNEVKSSITVIAINKGTYPGTVSKTINIIKNRSGKQMGTLTAADFFPEGKAPAGTEISGLGNATGEIVNVTRNRDLFKGYILNYITVDDNITSTTDQTCTVTISSTNYQDIEATLTFRPTDKETVTIKGLTYTDKTYDSSAMEPAGTLKVSDDKVPVKELEVLYEGTSANGTNYSSSSAPKDAGAYKVTYKVADSNENYTGSVEYTFTISPKNVTAGMIDTIAAQEYTGSAITPEPVVKDGEVTLVSGTDFDFSYGKNINAGENTATVTINGKGNYTGTASRTFTISPKDIKGAVITLQADSLGYTGLMQEVQITSVRLDQVTLTANDYDIVNNSNEQINADASITLTIAGKGNYTGTATTTWKITRATPALDNFDVTPDLSQKQTYDGKPKEVTAKTKNGVIDMGDVTVCYEGTSGTTYPRSETAPTNAGIYKVILSVVEGKNYTKAEIVAGTLTIEKADLTVEDVTEFFEYTKKGEQTISLAELVPGATNYAPGTYTDDNGILTGDLTIDATGLMKFTLSALTIGNIDNKVTVPVTITSENYKDVTVNVIIYISPEYRIIEGANSSWTQNTDGTVVIRGDGEFNRFHAVKVDGKVIDRANYDAKEGSTIITLKAEYLKTLSTGSHTFAIVWNNGIAGTNFTVAANTSGNNSGNNGNNNDSNHGSDNSGNNDSGNTAGAAANTAAASAQELDKIPATGDPFGIWLTLFAISLTGLAGMLARRKKN